MKNLLIFLLSYLYVYYLSFYNACAFYRVHHVKLLHRLCDIGVPLQVVRLIANWYSKIIMKVKWENCYSPSCIIKSGVRQGGVLSPVLFNVYFNVIVNSLQHSKLGCELYGEYIGCLVYADDIFLLSASVVMLQKMLSVCHTKGCV